MEIIAQAVSMASAIFMSVLCGAQLTGSRLIMRLAIPYSSSQLGFNRFIGRMYVKYAYILMCPHDYILLWFISLK